MAEVGAGTVGLRLQEEEVVVKMRLVQLRVTPASVGCEAGYVPTTREKMEEGFA